MTYLNFEIAIVAGAGLKFLDVVACDMAAALADVHEAFADVEVVSVSLK